MDVEEVEYKGKKYYYNAERNIMYDIETEEAVGKKGSDGFFKLDSEKTIKKFKTKVKC